MSLPLTLNNKIASGLAGYCSWPFFSPRSCPQEFSGTPVLSPLLPPFSICFLPQGEIALLEGLTVVYKSSIDLYFYVIGSSYENEVRISAHLLPLMSLLKPWMGHSQPLVLSFGEPHSSDIWQGHKEVG